MRMIMNICTIDTSHSVRDAVQVQSEATQKKMLLRRGTGGLTMADIKTKLNVGDTVWWVHCSNKIYKGTVEEISCCDYQGALY